MTIVLGNLQNSWGAPERFPVRLVSLSKVYHDIGDGDGDGGNGNTTTTTMPTTTCADIVIPDENKRKDSLLSFS